MLPVNPEVVANRFIDISEKSGSCLTNMQVQKLVFIAHGYTLALRDSALVTGEAKAFQFGPVLPVLYDLLRIYGRGCVDKIQVAVGQKALCADQEQIILAVWKHYGGKSAGQLSALTHRRDTPWSQVWARHRFGPISNDIIADHYKQLINR